MSALSRGGWLSAGLVAVVGLGLVVLGQGKAALALTAAALVAMISALWLERVLTRVIQPGRLRLTKSLVWQGLSRLVFLVVAGAAFYVVRRQVEGWAVALGVTLAMVGWVWAGVRGR
ncbi:MAG: hypothetical protein NZ869_01765 [Thermoanaerobaculum sp.]|nr:hypothetical protein [Thermoanaerobaculum sp.]MDW7967342.1 hypothetical protein [Thermoanaerobaculum sp.]